MALLLGASLLRAEVNVLKNFTLIDGSGAANPSLAPPFSTPAVSSGWAR